MLLYTSSPITILLEFAKLITIMTFISKILNNILSNLKQNSLNQYDKIKKNVVLYSQVLYLNNISKVSKLILIITPLRKN